MEKCECGSGIESTAHYFAGRLLCFDCPKCFKKNDDERLKEALEEQIR